ncbi:hypothetical protein CDD83_6730 [Cordyceps sp. RAO-2017]|nr:hypothetical protein CDD83_6730 [Cordyceps sp. RAO-2017]
MTAPAEVVSEFKSTLEPYIKPREQVNYIRRILTLHLGSFIGQEATAAPLSLAAGTDDASAGVELQGVFKDYLDALQVNVAARRQFDALLQATRSEDKPQSKLPSSGSDLLQGHLTLLKLRQKRDCLLAVERSLDSLAEYSGQNLLDTDAMLDGAAALPSVPKSVVDSLVAEQSIARPDLRSRAAQLDKAVLRARLYSKQEEKRLADLKARCEGRSTAFGNSARLEALNATRGELISWIEAELGKASTQEVGESERDESARERDDKTEDVQAFITKRLSTISQKYADYVAVRREALALVSNHQQPSLSPPRQPASLAECANDADSRPAAVDHLLMPYLETLLSISRHQKALMAHKSHTSEMLSKQSKNAGQVLDRLAEESQLLPSYPAKMSRRRRSGMAGETIRSSDHQGISARVRPWITAADSAKIATLESVAEKIESGQLALEGCMMSLQDIDRLLGEDSKEATEDEDVAQPSTGDARRVRGQNKAEAGKQYGKDNVPERQRGDPWSRLHGNLGFRGHEDAA